MKTKDLLFLNFLVSRSILTKEERKIVELELSKREISLVECITEFGFINKNTLYKLLENFENSKKYIHDFIVDTNLLKMVSYNFCVKNKCLPIYIRENILTVIMCEQNINVISELERHILFLNTDIVECEEVDLLEMIEKNYTKISDWLDVIEEADSVSIFVDRLLLDAVSKTASDIHFSVDHNIVRVRYRINGELIRVFMFHKDYYSKILVRLKLIFSVDITNSFKSRDGNLNKIISGERFGFRISFHQCMHGENVVIRILRNIDSISLEDLGYSDKVLNDIKDMVKKRDGLVVFVGTTGSGKTTSMYSCIKEIDHNRNNIMTVEDPVECELRFVQQTDVNQHPNSTFASCLRSILRQDPDVLVIGEIRDAETAAIAIRAAITGHKVFATLHAKDIPTAIDRFVEFGVDKNICLENICGIVSQRLVSKKCDECFGKGCELCYNSGHFGRSLVAESAVFNEKLIYKFKNRIYFNRKNNEKITENSLSKDNLEIMYNNNNN